MEQNILDKLIADNVAISSKAKSTETVVTVFSVTDWKPTNKGNLPVKMVRTDKGTYFPLANSISNLPTSFAQPIQAKAVFTPGKDAQGNDRLNLSRLEFAGLDTQKVLMIREMPKGTALFALAV